MAGSFIIFDLKLQPGILPGLSGVFDTVADKLAENKGQPLAVRYGFRCFSGKDGAEAEFFQKGLVGLYGLSTGVEKHHGFKKVILVNGSQPCEI